MITLEYRKQSETTTFWQYYEFSRYARKSSTRVFSVKLYVFTNSDRNKVAPNHRETAFPTLFAARTSSDGTVSSALFTRPVRVRLVWTRKPFRRVRANPAQGEATRHTHFASPSFSVGEDGFPFRFHRDEFDQRCYLLRGPRTARRSPPTSAIHYLRLNRLHLITTVYTVQ